MLAFFVMSDSVITYPICDVRSLLLAKKTSVNTSNYSILISNLTNFSSLAGLLICQSRYLFKAFTSSSSGLIIWAAKDKSKKASGWQTDAIYAPLARWAIYWSFGVSILVTPLVLVLGAILVMIILRFLHCRSWVRVIPSGVRWIKPLLNFSGVSLVSCSRFFAINFAFSNSSCSIFAKFSSPRNRVSSVYSPITPKGSLLCRKQGSYVDCSIRSFSTWCSW